MADEKFKVEISPEARARLMESVAKIGELGSATIARAHMAEMAQLMEHERQMMERARGMRPRLSRDELARLIETKLPSEVARIAADHGVTTREFEAAMDQVVHAFGSKMPMRDPMAGQGFTAQFQAAPARPQFEPPWDEGERRRKIAEMHRQVMDDPMEVRERVREQQRAALAAQLGLLGDELDRMVLP